MLKSIFFFLCMVMFVSCSSTHERKPFMIVGKVETPTRYYTVLNLGGSIGSTDNRQDQIGTKYHSFFSRNLYPNIFTIWHLPFVSVALGDKYTYSWLTHNRTDEKGNVLEVEKYRAETHSPYVFLTETLFCPKRVGCFVLTASYLPYVKTSYSNFVSFNSIGNQKYKGKGYEGDLMLYRGRISFSLKYQKLIFPNGYNNESLFFAMDTYFTMF